MFHQGVKHIIFYKHTPSIFEIIVFYSVLDIMVWRFLKNVPDNKCDNVLIYIGTVHSNSWAALV